MKPAVLLSALLVAGCSSIEWFGQPEPSSRGLPTVSAGDEAALAALEGCKAQARAVIQRDSMIDRDISGGAPLDGRTDDSADLIRNMDAFEVQQRYERIIGSCMRQRGYALPAGEPVR